MSDDENKGNDGGSGTDVHADKGGADGGNDIDFKSEYSKLKSEHEKAVANLEKARKGETDNRKRRLELEEENEKLRSTDWKAKFEELSSKQTQRIVDAALADALKEAKVKDAKTALKLIDKTKVALNGDEADAKTVAAVIKALQESDPILFDEVKVPDARRQTDGNPKGGFETELAAAVTQKQIEAVLRKYGHI